jgi:hypothetical protein
MRELHKKLGLESPLAETIKATRRLLGQDGAIFVAIEATQRLTHAVLGFTPMWEVFQAIGRLHDEERQALITLASHGWYIDPGASFAETREPAELFASGSSGTLGPVDDR